MCDCRKNIEDRLLTRFKEQEPTAREHAVSLKGYAFILGEEVQEKGVMQIEATAKFPLKKGGEKLRATKQSMIFSYCPFCGVKYA